MVCRLESKSNLTYQYFVHILLRLIPFSLHMLPFFPPWSFCPSFRQRSFCCLWHHTSQSQGEPRHCHKQQEEEEGETSSIKKNIYTRMSWQSRRLRKEMLKKVYDSLMRFWWHAVVFQLCSSVIFVLKIWFFLTFMDLKELHPFCSAQQSESSHVWFYYLMCRKNCISTLAEETAFYKDSLQRYVWNFKSLCFAFSLIFY